MGKLIVFNSVSLDGYFTDPKGDMSFAYNDRKDPEWDRFVEGNASGAGALLFGRITYEMMARYWPTPAAAESMPVVAERMNNSPKFVFSRTMDRATWKNTTLLTGDLHGEILTLKAKAGAGIAVLGSGSIVSQLAQHGLIDEYQLVIIPVLLGSGRTMFEGLGKRLSLEVVETRTFRNGKIFLRYVPAGQRGSTTHV
jgi:dihydrofolate reductase